MAKGWITFLQHSNTPVLQYSIAPLLRGRYLELLKLGFMGLFRQVLTQTLYTIHPAGNFGYADAVFFILQNHLSSCN